MSSELQAVESQHGAVFTTIGERQVPTRFHALGDEWRAVRQGCGLLDAGFRALWRLTGGDRVTFLQGMITNDVAKLESGAGTYAALLTIQGRVVSDMRVYALAEELWLDVPASHAANVRDSLERYIIADDVEFAPVEDVVPLVILEGPQAARVLVGVVGESVTDLAAFAHREVVFDGVHVRVAAATHSGEAGYIIFGPPEIAARLWAHCHAAGAEPVGLDALDVLRVEAGIPWVGRDMDESTLIGEVGIESAISYKKGCYLGQEVVERVAARGQVQRKLVGLLCAGTTPPPFEAKLLHDGKETGWITSAVWSPAREQLVALGYLRREAWDEGTGLSIEWADGQTIAQVGALPFVGR